MDFRSVSRSEVVGNPISSLGIAIHSFSLGSESILLSLDLYLIDVSLYTERFVGPTYQLQACMPFSSKIVRIVIG